MLELSVRAELRDKKTEIRSLRDRNEGLRERAEEEGELRARWEASEKNRKEVEMALEQVEQELAETKEDVERLEKEKKLESAKKRGSGRWFGL
jgi:chromosome segregation ATPase